jgi:RecJ-like exonuclease
MGSCIICGASADGRVCDTHQEDVVFEFRGDRPGQLTDGRYYRGTVDGYADFGVFVDLAEGVTGLLHRSKLDRRLESLDWEPGDTVYVQVTNVRDNGDIDLGWSIRQSDREFRGTLIDDPGGDRLPDEEDDDDDDADDDHAGDGRSGGDGADDADDADATEQVSDGGARTSAPPTPGAARGEGEPSDGPEETETSETEPSDDGASPDETGATESTGDAEEPSEGAEAGEPDDADGATPERVAVETLGDRVGEDVRIEGEVVSVRQTSGPTVFELRDETGVVDCAAFKEAGVRAYPSIETGDVVRLDGEVRVRREELQVETEALVALVDEERAVVEGRMDAALDDQATPASFEPLVEDPVVAERIDDLEALATAIRRAVLQSRPVVVRHAATAEGYLAGAAIERATLPLVREEHTDADAAYHYFDRRPLEDGVYAMDDATTDVTRMLDNRERHDEKLPLFVFAAAGTTRDSLDGLDLLDVYDARAVAIDGPTIDPEIRETVESAADAGGERTAATLAATVAAGIEPDVADDLRHLPAVSYWTDAPAAYVEAAAGAGVDTETARRLREAVALEACYQTYEDKRQLISELLFERATGLAREASDQFRRKLDDELATTEANLDVRTVGDASMAVLDTDAFTHRFDFPPVTLLLDELHRRTDEPVTVGVGRDELYLRADADLAFRAVAGAARERAPDAGISARGSRAGKLVFLAGEREAAVDAVLEAVAERL